MKKKTLSKIKFLFSIFVMAGVVSTALYFYNTNPQSDNNSEKNSFFQSGKINWKNSLYSSLLGHGKKIKVIDHGEEVSLDMLDIINYITDNEIKTVGDVIQFLNIPLTKKQSQEIGLCRELDKLSGDDKIVITADMYEYGVASWYGPGFQGRLTANGEIYNIYDSTAAHKTLPLGSMVRVFNISNNKSTIVRINDRGPYIAGRIIDLSLRAKQELEMNDLTKVYIEILDQNLIYKECN